MVTFSHADPGTDEADWAGSGLSAAPELPLGPGEPRDLRVVVLAAHPDDETLGAGGLIASLQAVGASIEVVLCTAGEGSHPSSPTMEPGQLAAVRLEEFAAALAALGLPGRHWQFLGMPDSGLDGHVQAIAEAVRDAVRRLPEKPGPVVLVAPYRADGHPDHDALGAVAAEVALQDGHGLLEYPIWYWHWADPGSPDWHGWLRYHLDTPVRGAKDRAMAEHATQIRPLSPLPGDEVMLDERFLRHFSRSFEMFAWTPPRELRREPYRSTDAAGIFDRIHDRAEDPWDYLSSWYERRKRALTLAVLPRESYSSGLEIGCSIGTLTAGLAARCRSLLAVDASASAVARAAGRLAGMAHVAVRHMVVPGTWPSGPFDLVVMSEVGYYLAPDELDAAWDSLAETMAAGGTLVLCHWRHPVAGWSLDGEAVHAAARKRLGWRVTGVYREQDFILETLAAPAAPAAVGDPE